MFSNLRTNSQVYLLHKDATPYVEVGTVVSVSQPVPRYPSTNFMAQQELTVDVVLKINGSDVTLQKLPANLDTADQGSIAGSVFIATSKEAMNSEIMALKQKSQSILESVDYHRKAIQDYDNLLQSINPEVAEKKKQQAEMDNLKAQVSDLTSAVKDLMASLRKETKD